MRITEAWVASSIYWIAGPATKLRSRFSSIVYDRAPWDLVHKHLRAEIPSAQRFGDTRLEAALILAIVGEIKHILSGDVPLAGLPQRHRGFDCESDLVVGAQRLGGHPAEKRRDIEVHRSYIDG